MKKIDDGGPAFPYTEDKTHIGMGIKQNNGMTLRDYFAGQALMGMMEKYSQTNCDIVSGWSYQFADAMIAERNK